MQPVSCSTNIGQVNLRYDSVGFYGSLSPVLWFRLMIAGTPRAEQKPARPEDLMVSEIKGLLLLSNGIRIGTLSSERPYILLYQNGEQTLELYLELDHYKLHQIEEFRKGSDLSLQMNIIFVMEKRGQPQNKEIGGFNNIKVEIPKSEWVEKILPNIGFKDVSLIEIPKINQKWQKIIEHINEAWHQHSMGKYDKVLIECRKALEALGNEVKNKGFTKDEGKSIPDWEKLFNSENVGDTVGTINKKFYGFLAPSAHTGKAINKEDADFALLVMHGIVTLVTENLKMQEI
ncbi:MAG: hypothetical protein KKI06_01435 [Euryarchaeota archaeon]|nr:hypothetical protein [Euryarchaeota archaeon]MBU4222699.1 hypothetical protein [Euryarchaeota archaeon]MCG2738184.1 hypothetical protein [Candidatus Methanoperedenaceae archaeon]